MSIGNADRIVIRDLVLEARIGVHPGERDRPQPIRINVTLHVPRPDKTPQALSQVVCYGQLTEDICALVEGEHVDLVEELAERIASLCLEDGRVEAVRVRVEKLEAVARAAGVGVEIDRSRPTESGS